ncbi:hypothetical protein FGO68_gene17762 [Halteria grandinella]|uniref:non-specific serine/threonine protein kinase n=1 Tax=Halteria grandinella TaxID=5974 RepID=A0A8J8NZK6_HALGN|nr:hypothetical protein FGO68_gene17762 [Halteria grandinella]
MPQYQVEKVERKEAPVLSTSSNLSQALQYQRGQKKIFEDFQLVKKIGQGAISKVYHSRHQYTGINYAIKSIRKDRIILNEMFDCAWYEKQIMESLNHPFLMKLEGFFNEQAHIYFLMPYYPLGNLRQQLKYNGNFPEQVVRLMAAQMILAISHLHERGIVYRDLKPENILVGNDGYLVLADFGVSVPQKPGEMLHDIVGTHDYMAPELIKRVPYSYEVDWWALGILIYELLVSVTPFESRSLEITSTNIVSSKLKWPVQYHGQPFRLSETAKDLIRSLLKKDLQSRLGTKNGGQEILQHEFFRGIDKNRLLKRELLVEWMPMRAQEYEQQDIDLGESIVGNREQLLIHQYRQQFSYFSK